VGAPGLTLCIGKEKLARFTGKDGYCLLRLQEGKPGACQGTDLGSVFNSRNLSFPSVAPGVED
jgi:hypothetical protein